MYNIEVNLRIFRHSLTSSCQICPYRVTDPDHGFLFSVLVQPNPRPLSTPIARFCILMRWRLLRGLEQNVSSEPKVV